MAGYSSSESLAMVLGMAEEGTNAGQSHATGFTPLAVAAQKKAIRAMWPGMSSRQIAAALDNKITAGNVRQWQAGIRPIPPWVKDIMLKWCTDVEEALAAIKPGPGSKAGWNNLSAWRAAQNVER